MRKKYFLLISILVGVIAFSSLGGVNSEANQKKFNNNNKTLNYYYKADAHISFEGNMEDRNINPKTLTINHYVDGYYGQLGLYKQEQFFFIDSINPLFNPKDYYLDLSHTEYDPELSYNNLESDEPITIEDVHSVINYYYKADERISFEGNMEDKNLNPKTLTINHYIDGYYGQIGLYKQEQFFFVDSIDPIFDPKDYYLDLSYTEYDPDLSYNSLESDAPIKMSDLWKIY